MSMVTNFDPDEAAEALAQYRKEQASALESVRARMDAITDKHPLSTWQFEFWDGGNEDCMYIVLTSDELTKCGVVIPWPAAEIVLGLADEKLREVNKA